MGGSSKRVTVGYDYYMDAHVVVQSNGADEVSEIIYGERTAWAGKVTQNQDIYINNPNLFGGRNREGGVQGLVSIMFGRADQERNPYLAAYQGACPAYRGVVSLLFKRFMWSSMNPYFKAIWARTTNIFHGWKNDTPWYPEKASIKRLKGVPAVYTIKVQWVAEDFNAPQTVGYTLQYRLVGESAWTDIASGTFSGGRFPADSPYANKLYGPTVNNGGLLGIAGGSSPSPGAVNFGLGNTLNTFSQGEAGSTRQGSRNHAVTLMHEFYEFQIVKTSGSRQIKSGPFGGTIETLTGVEYGGTVAVSEVIESIPVHKDMNPAHILYRLFTADQWRVRWPIAKIDDAQWRETADKLYAEGFGLSYRFSFSAETEDHIQEVIDTIGAYTLLNPVTGLLELHLIRDDYEIDDLVELNEDNFRIDEFDGALYGDLPNTMVVEYLDDNENAKTVTWSSAAAMRSQGGSVVRQKAYRGVHTPRIALQLAQRDVKATASLLRRITGVADRRLWAHTEGMVVAVTDAELGFTKAPYRIAKISKGDYLNNEIQVELVEDVFGLADTVYDINPDVTPPYSIAVPQPVSYGLAFELPYWVVFFSSTEADRAALPPGYGFAGFFITRNPNGAYSYSYDVLASLDGETYQTLEQNGDYAPTGFLSENIEHLTESITLTNRTDFTVSNLEENPTILALLGDEWVSVESFNDGSGAAVIRRGCLDTVPKKHPAGTRFMILQSSAANDPTTRLVGDEMFYKPIPVSVGQALNEEDALALSLEYNRRAERPYPPGQFRINGAYYPSTVFGSTIEVTWAHRDREGQTVYLVDSTEDSVGPEPGTTYRIRLYDATVLVATYDGISGASWSYPVEDQIAHGAIQSLRITLESVRAGLASWQAHDHTIVRTGYGFNYGLFYGGADDVPEPIAVAVTGSLEGTNAVFTVTMSGVYGDQLDHEFSFGGTATAADIGAVEYSDDVFETLFEGLTYLAVPAGVSTFTVTVPLIADADADAGETLSFTIGSITETITITE